MNNNSEKIYSFLNSIDEPVFYLSADITIIDLNLSAKKLLGINKDAILGKSILEILPNFSKINHQNLQKLNLGFEDKGIFWYFMHSKLDDKIMKYMLFGFNYANNYIYEEIKKLTQTLTGVEQNQDKNIIERVKDIYHYMDNIISKIPISVYWMNRDYIYLGCSNDMAKLLKLKSRHDIVGKTYSDLYDEKSSLYYKKADKQVMDTGVSLSAEEPLYFEDGTKKIYLSKKVPLHDSNKNIIGMLGISLDITERKKSEEDIKAAKEAAESASVAKTEFIANMSHDIRTPLSGVVGLGGIVERKVTDPEIKDNIHDIVKSADELLNMLNEILDVVSMDNISVKDIQSEPFDLSHLVQSIIDLEKSSVDLKKIQLLQTIDANIPPILIGDHKKIHHILLNLVGNSIKFTKDGYVSIDIKLSKILNDEVELLFTVTDTGIGIPKESLDKVFELFYKVTPSYKGLDKGHGVGLHIVKIYTELLGGSVNVESELGKGSKFSFSLILKITNDKLHTQNHIDTSLFELSEEPPSLPSTQTLASTSLPNVPEILIIEDDYIALKIAQTLIKQANCNPTTADDGETGFDLAKNQKFDLIITDIGLPGISGVEFAQQLRNYEKQHNKNSIPIIALTAHAEKQYHNKCTEAGIDAVMIKPISVKIIDEILSKFLLQNAQNSQLINTTKNPEFGNTELDLPENDTELFEIEHEIIFDIASAKKILGENRAELLMELVKDTIKKNIPQELVSLKAAHDAGQWQTVADISHKLKGGFLSIGFKRAATACKYLERYHKTGRTELLEKLYQQVLKTLELTSNRLMPFIS